MTLGWHCVDALWTLCWCSVDMLLMLCWCSFWGAMVSTHTILPINAANTSIMHKCHSTGLGLYKVQHTKSLTLCWRSFSEWGCDHDAITFVQNSCQYDDYGYLPYQSPWIIQDAIPKIVDTLLTLFWRGVDALLTLCWRSVDALLTLCWRSVDAHLVV